MWIVQAVQCCSFLQALVWNLLQDSKGAPAFEILVQALPIQDRLAAVHPGS